MSNDIESYAAIFRFALFNMGLTKFVLVIMSDEKVYLSGLSVLKPYNERPIKLNRPAQIVFIKPLMRGRIRFNHDY